MAQISFNLAPERKIWSVSELTNKIRDLLEGAFDDLLVQGEVSNLRPAQSGHLYFTLKDARAQVRCVCFRDKSRLLKFRPEDGLQITVRGKLGVYEVRGEYQLYVEHIEPVGFGALQLAFEQLKQRLEAEGLFAPARKKPLPLLPRRIGLVTSPTGAAVRDVLRILGRRFPNLHILLYPVRVQGEGAAEEIAEAIEHLNRAKAADVLLLARGGGSLEDLWAFNEEIVARAIAASRIPVVTGVGHETDFTIADFVADLRASTPSNAAEIVVRSKEDFERDIARHAQHLVQRIRYLLLHRRHRVQELAGHRGFRRLEGLVRQRRQRADELAARLGELLVRRLEVSRRRLAVAQARIAAFRFEPLVRQRRQRAGELAGRLAELLVRRLEVSRRRLAVGQARVASFDLRVRITALRARLGQRTGELGARIERLLTARQERVKRLRMQLEERSPLRVLERGYAIVYDAAGNVLREAAKVETGEEITVRLHRGTLGAEVRKRKP
jgi:exodeoxyribonuclease VII large subunit